MAGNLGLWSSQLGGGGQGKEADGRGILVTGGKRKDFSVIQSCSVIG